MRQVLRNLRIVFALFLALSFALLGGIIYQQNKSRHMTWGHAGENKLALRERYANAGTIYSRDGLRLAFSEGNSRHYATDTFLASALVQIIGDYTHNIGNTVEERYQNILTGYGRSVLDQILMDFSGRGKLGYELILSLDSRICRKAAELIEGLRAAVVVMNYKTGELLAVVNSPFVAPENVIKWENIPEGALFNKALMGQYSPGSTFKTITDTAWLCSPNYEPGLIVECKGQTPLLGPGSVNELRTDAGHGRVDREHGMAWSCNHFFGAVGIKAGAQQLLHTAEAFGFNKPISIGEISVASSVMKLLPDMDDYVLSWLSIGQEVEGTELRLTPLELAMMSAGIANEGVIVKPRLVLEARDPLSRKMKMDEEGVFSRIADAEAMRVVAGDMEASAQYGMAKSAAVSGLEIGGKTGTAQFRGEDGQNHNNALYTGFIKNSSAPFAFGIIAEDASIDISAIAGALSRYIAEIYVTQP